MNLLELARHEEDAIPGARLVAFFEKEFPIYKIDLSIGVREPRGVSLIAWFVLRLLHENVVNEVDIQSLLGVPLTLTRKALYELTTLGYVCQVPTITGQKHKLLDKGIIAIEEGGLSKIHDETITIKMDAITGKISNYLDSYSKIDPDDALRPFYPYPTINEISSKFLEIRELYKTSRSNSQYKNQKEMDDIIGISNIYTEYRKMRLLVYQDISESFLFRVFDRHYYAPDYEEKLEHMAKDGVEIWHMDDKGEYFPSLEEKSQGKTEEISHQISQDNTQEDVMTKINKYLPQIREGHTFKERLGFVLSTTEHFIKLQETLTEARDEIIIISPWVSNEVTDELEKLMKEFLKRGGFLWIGYGYPSYKDDTKMQRTNQTIKELQRRLNSKNFHAVLLGDTHEKILISDRKFAIIGSYNWLSFRGDRRRGFVSEVSYCIEELESVEDIYRRTMRRLQLKQGERND